MLKIYIHNHSVYLVSTFYFENSFTNAKIAPIHLVYGCLMKLVRVLLVMVGLGFVVGCGQKGPLFQPDIEKINKAKAEAEVIEKALSEREADKNQSNGKEGN